VYQELGLFLGKKIQMVIFGSLLTTFKVCIFEVTAAEAKICPSIKNEVSNQLKHVKISETHCSKKIIERSVLCKS
jgi:hypothetical protein